MATIINADTVIGGAIVTGDASGILALQAAGNTGFTLNSSRAIGVGAAASFGTANQILVSAGSAAAPTWSSTISVTTITLSGDASINGLTIGQGPGSATTFNTAIGNSVLAANTTGGSNTAVGRQAMSSNLGGSNNSAFGIAALNANTSGNYNVGFGHGAIQNNTSGIYNTAVGFSAGRGAAGNTASGNISIGYETLLNATGGYNIVIGHQAGSAITSGQYNVIIGNYTGSLAPISATGSSNIVLATGGGTIRQTWNTDGALGVGSTPAYGTAGQVLTSAGSAAVPTWATPAGGQAFVAFGSTGGF